MNILYVLDFFYPYTGGVPTVFYNLAKSMVKRGHDVTVLSSHVKGSKKFEVKDGIKIFRIGSTRPNFMAKSPLKMLSMKKDFDIVHTSTYSAIIPSYIFSSLKNIPRIVTVHEVWNLKEWTEFMRERGVFYFFEERILLNFPFDQYIVPSRHTKSDLEPLGIPKNKIKTIPHGIDTFVFNPKNKRFRNVFRKRYGFGEEIVGAFVGKTSIFKGTYNLLDALKKIFTENGSMKFVFMLPSTYGSDYRKFIKKINSDKILKDRIVILKMGKEHDFVARTVAACDFLVMPSMTEGFGFAVAEAASMGVPVIVTKGTSLVEIVDENKHALFVRQRNTNDLVIAMRKLAHNKKLRKKLSMGKKFKTWEDVSDDYVKVYEDVIRKHKKSKKR